MSPALHHVNAGLSGARGFGLARPSLDKTSGNVPDRYKLPALPGRFPSCDPMHSRVNLASVNRVRSPLSIPAPSFARLYVDDDCHYLESLSHSLVTRKTDCDRDGFACVQKGFAK